MNQLKKLKSGIFWGILIIFSSYLFSYSTIDIAKTDQPPKIDGKLNESIWQSATKFSGFKTYQPDYGKTASQKTEVYITYDPDEPFQGKGNRASLSLEYQPTEKLNFSLDLSFSNFYREADSERIYNYTIMRNRTTFQINKYLFFRGIAEYNTYWKKLTVDFLASFTYIPGTVVYMGYGSIFEKIKWENREYVNSDRFLETKLGFFFKISYLWRL